MPRTPLSQIAFDAGTQIRAAINESVVAEYADRMTEGIAFPPIVLFTDGTCREDSSPIYFIADGFHRAQAALRNSFKDIDAEVRPGTKQDALWFALGANKANGQRLTDADKKHAIVLAIKAWPDRSAAMIAEQLGCNHVYVTRLRQQEFTSKDLPSKVIGKDGKSYPAVRGTNDTVGQRRDMRREEIAALVKAGHESREIVETLKIRPDEVASVRRELGVGRDTSKAGIAKRKQDVRDMAGRGYTTRQIASALHITEESVGTIATKESIYIHADRVVGKTKRHDSTRIVEQMVMDAENLTADVNLIDFASLDRASIARWLDSLTASQKSLVAFIKRLKEQKNVEAA